MCLLDAVHTECGGSAGAHIPAVYRVLVGARRAGANRLVDHVGGVSVLAGVGGDLLYPVAECKEVWMSRVCSSFSFHSFRVACTWFRRVVYSDTAPMTNSFSYLTWFCLFVSLDYLCL